MDNNPVEQTSERNFNVHDDTDEETDHTGERRDAAAADSDFKTDHTELELDYKTGHSELVQRSNESEDSEVDARPDAQDEEDKDMEYYEYEQSFEDDQTKPEQSTTMKVKQSVTRQRKTDQHICPVCFMSFTDIEDLKVHQLGHSKPAELSCIACGTDFTTKRALDKHMLVDASILNQLLSSKETVTLPERLCKTVLDILVESAPLPASGNNLSGSSGSGVEDGQVQEKKGEELEEVEDPDDDLVDDDVVDDDLVNDDQVDDDVVDDDMVNDDEQDENMEEEEEEEDENLPSDIEQDLEEAEGSESEEKVSVIPRPFLSSSFTDTPVTASPCDNDDSMTSQSHNSTEDVVVNASSSSTSRRKKKRPMQVPRSVPARQNAKAGNQLTVKLNPEGNGDKTQVQSGLPNADQSSLVCPMCGEMVSDKQKLTIHIAEHEKFFPFFCALCDANFMESWLLEAHVTSCHHDNLLSSRNQQCRMCGMYFKQQDSLAVHIKYCRQPPACVVCGAVFDSGPQLQGHYYSHSEKERASAEFLSCNDCGEAFVSTVQLRNHHKSHGTVQPYTCKVCGISFRLKKVHDRHLQVHARPQECKCELCGVQLLTRSGYIAHLRGHKNNDSMESDIADRLLGMLKATSRRRRSKKGRKERQKEGEDEEEGEEKKDLTLDTKEYLKLVDEQATPLTVAVAPTKKIKRDINFFKTRIHSCPFCELTFTSPEEFQAHVGSLHKDQAHFDECDVCHQKFYGKEYLQRHHQTHGKPSNTTYPCDQCSKVFRRKFSLETHRKVHTFKKFIPCDICGEQFRFINEVEKHKYRVHKYDRIQNLFECNLCKVKFGTLSHLNVHCRHTHKSDEGKPFKCAKCMVVFATCIELKKHIFGSHEKGPCAGQTIKQEPSDDGFEEQVRAALDKFLPIFPHSEGIKETVIPAMVKEEPDDDEDEDEDIGVEEYNRLTRQKMSHSTMAKRFICETCHKCFATKSDLRTHIRTHTGETPYKCEYCDRAFKQRGHRKLHIQVVHTKEMPYTCELCGQGYPTRYRYQIHLKRHSGIKEHKCQFCDKAYYTVGKLNEHKRKNHKDELVLAEQEAE